MENQINFDSQSPQSIGQNPLSQLAQIPQKPGTTYWKVFSLLLFVILLACGIFFVFNTKNKSSSSQQPKTPNQTDETKVIGVLRASGLSDEEKLKFGLTTANFQVTDFGDYQKAYQEGQIMGYYLKSDTKYDELLGKCVQVAGVIPEEWKNKNIRDSYHRLALSVTTIEKIDNSTCNPYSQTPLAPNNTQEKLVLRGTVVHVKRPAPDIGYDYQLELEIPFVDKFSSAGSPQTVSLVDITPGTNDLWNEIEMNINKEITVEGYMVWGYAESRYLQVLTVNGHNSNIILKSTVEPTSRISIENWKEYAVDNTYSIKYPPEIEIDGTRSTHATVVFSGKELEIILVNTANNNPSFASRLKPLKTFDLNGVSWTLYPKSNYCDAGNCNDTPFTYETSNEKTIATILIQKGDHESELIRQILGTFKF